MNAFTAPRKGRTVRFHKGRLAQALTPRTPLNSSTSGRSSVGLPVPTSNAAGCTSSCAVALTFHSRQCKCKVSTPIFTAHHPAPPRRYGLYSYAYSWKWNPEPKCRGTSCKPPQARKGAEKLSPDSLLLYNGYPEEVPRSEVLESTYSHRNRAARVTYQGSPRRSDLSG